MSPVHTCKLESCRAFWSTKILQARVGRSKLMIDARHKSFSSLLEPAVVDKYIFTHGACVLASGKTHCFAGVDRQSLMSMRVPKEWFGPFA